MSNFLYCWGCVIPLRLASPDQFLLLREFLEAAGYRQDAVCARLGLKNTQGYLHVKANAGGTPEDLLDLLIRLFLVGETLAWTAVKTAIATPVLDAFLQTGLLVRIAETCYAPVALYPARALYIVSDRWTPPAGVPVAKFDDIVYPAVTVHTDHLLDMLPAEPCEAFLDLCSGTGISGMVAARHAHHVWAFDVTERATLFAEFNRQLNGIANLTAACGDLYQPAGDQTFDRIAANPPYMPSRTPAEIYADGGALGERITRRVVEDLPHYLRPGGCLYLITGGAESDEQPFEQRVRAWLGAAHSGFDVFVIVRQTFDPADMAYQAAARVHGGQEEVAELKELYQRSGVDRFVYASVLIQRRRASTAPVTVRRQTGRHFGAAELEWLRAWETAAADPAMVSRILDARPIASPQAELRVVHRMQNGELTPVDFVLTIGQPYDAECRIQPWTAHLVARCDGRTTARQHLAHLKEQQLVHPETPPDEFAGQLRIFISGGFLEIDGHRPPRSPDTPPLPPSDSEIT